MNIVVSILILGLSTFVLTKSAAYFTTYAEKLGLLLGMSSFLIGATILSIGTSLPELVSALYAVIETNETIFVADAIVGSNIANTLLILGIGAISAKQLRVHTSLIDIDLPFLFMSTGLFTLFAWDGSIVWTEGIFLLLFFVTFTAYTVFSRPQKRDSDEMRDLEKQFSKDHHDYGPLKKGFYYAGRIIVMGILMALAAKFFIDSLIDVASALGVATTFLTITVAAIGTSLPELFASLTAIKHGNHGMAIGNALGSNTFNAALVAGLPAFFKTLDVSQEIITIGLPFLVFATLAAIFATQDDRLELWEGVAMIFIYVVFLGKIFAII